MVHLHINLRSPQDTGNWLTVRDDDQNEIFGPCRVLRPLNSPAPISETEQERAAVESTGEPYLVKEVIPMAGASLADIREFGRYGFIVLEHADQQTAGARQLTLHGGDSDANGQLTPSATSLRLSNSDMRGLVQLITRHGKHNVSVSCTRLHLDAEPLADAALTDLAKKPYLKFRMLPGWAAAAAVPFIAASPAYAQCNQYDSGTSFSAVDFGYLLIDEGGNLLTGYVPDNNSGVTIAGGLDLGLQTSSELLAMGFSQSQVTSWAPYLASSPTSPLIGANARAALAAHPLSITEASAASINSTYYASISNSVGAAYNSLVKSLGKLPGVTFSSLPAPWQTAIADMYLVDPSFTTTTCFTQLASGEWSAAITSLQTFNGLTESVNQRAKQNGDYLSTKMSGLPT
jgi:hypothetical protein